MATFDVQTVKHHLMHYHHVDDIVADAILDIAKSDEDALEIADGASMNEITQIVKTVSDQLEDGETAFWGDYEIFADGSCDLLD